MREPALQSLGEADAIARDVDAGPSSEIGQELSRVRSLIEAPAALTRG